MHPALFRLFLLSNKAVLRKALRAARTARGAVALIFSLGFIALAIMPQAVAAFFMRDRAELAGIIADRLEPFMPLLLTGFVLWFALTSAGARAIYFSPPEVDFLFPAPFSRRELLVFKLWKTAIGLFVFSLFVSLMTLNVFRSTLAAFVGIVLSLGMLQLAGMGTALVCQIVAESAYNRLRKLILSVIVLALIVGAAEALARRPVLGALALADGMRSTWAGTLVLAPSTVFTNVMFARNWFPDLVAWAALALSIDLVLLIAVVRLDADYLEAAAATSEKVYEQLRRNKQGGGFAMPVHAQAWRIRLPDPRHLGGIGPIAWRQLLLAIRTSRQVFVTVIFLAALYLAGIRFSPPQAEIVALATTAGIGLTVYLAFLFSLQVPWAFRGDIDHIEFLKTLPVHSLSLSVGELAAGVLVLSMLQIALLAVFAVAAPAGAAAFLVAAAFSAPFNGVMFGLGNLLFLLYPIRLVAGTTFDFQSFGKMMIFLMLKCVLLVPLLAIPAGAGAVAYLAAGFWWPAFALGAWIVLVCELVPLLLLVSWAFVRFEPGVDAPA
jgi:hypothetical protein